MRVAGQGDLGIWTITRNPSDLPGVPFAARLHLVRAAKVEATHQLLTGASLAEVRDKLPPGLFRLERDPGDDPAIVESWI